MLEKTCMTIAETARLISGYLDTTVTQRQILVWTFTASLPHTFSLKGLRYSEDQIYVWLDEKGDMLDVWADEQDMPMSMNLNQVTRYLNLYRIGEPLTTGNVLEWVEHSEIPCKKVLGRLTFSKNEIDAWIDEIVAEQEAEEKSAKKKPAKKAKAAAKKTAKKTVKKKAVKKK